MNADTQDASGREQEMLLAQLDALMEAAAPRSKQALLRSFVRQYYEPASYDALKLRTPAELVATALAHFRLVEKRAAGEAIVQVLPPDPASASQFAVVRTGVDDMPFLVDSISMAVRDAGSVIDWAVHPVLRFRRNAANAITAVYSAQEAEGGPESLIHAEIDPLPSPEAYAALEQNIREVLADLRVVVSEFEPMRAKAREVADSLLQVPEGADADEFAEAREFLLWLEGERFTFLGYSETELRTGKDGKSTFVNKPAAALGLARKGGRFADAEQLIAPKAELDKYTDSPRLVVITKANQKSPVRHAEYMDVVSVKRYAADGTLKGTSRFLGLFSVEAYIERPREIPLIRRKAAYVMAHSHVPEDSYGGKALRLILHTLPRDELFQSSEEQLLETAMSIRALRDRHQLKLFLRRDRYGRSYSAMVYLPRERYSRELRDRVGAELMGICGGSAIERHVEFPRGAQARIYYIVRTPPGTTLSLTTAEIEKRLIAVTRSWRDQLREILLAQPGKDSALLAARYADAFPLSYAEHATAAQAEEDLRYLARLSPSQRLLVNAGGRPQDLKLYSWSRPVGLSDVLPILENFGLRTVRQDPTEITPKDGESLWLQTFEITAALTAPPTAEQKAAFETAFLKCWAGEIENDGLNRLVLGAGLDWRQVTAVRLVTKYLIQTGLPYSQSYMEQMLGDHAAIARLLVQLFEARFDPALDDARRQAEEIKLAQAIDAALDKVASLDADRVLRAFLSVVRAGLRTNYYQSNATGEKKTYVSLKIDSSKVPELPLPRPLFEIFVYAPEVEGVHLRGGKVARGGLRWSDRRQDFRTEVLGLMKAQQVKNTVIVPVGAKGGFVVKKPVDPANRDAWLAQGIECYKTFVRGLLDVTDNRVAGKIAPPMNVVRHDPDDPYLVVAADKGTATFSDIANGLSAEYSFWLGDAFASGGSAGYDHKKMGITAKGAWESVKRHFREAGKNIQEEEFSVVGIGDMSGDVFGNGMLLSRKIRLIAAFDHRHIFLDPNPDCEKSFAERERMFALPRSSWADYDVKLISKGGGVHARNLKSIKLTDEVKKALDVRDNAMTPAELMKAILKAPVDLLWNGGIGTYVKGHNQAHQDVGDRANDAIRVNGRELRCKVVGEGGNLGFTQLGRVEYALAGGRLNTDAIDNAGGVHSSDREVNIKIPLNELMAHGKLSRKERDPLLVKMTGDIARFVLRDNYVQSAAVSMLERNAPARLDEHAELIRLL
ncbi:MAG TPA: NAD-glutamate dehydrogenase domain-containing protein, partial [Nevskiaceae bacterium]|nr:NAD-glutamate dehydrogenase domain-containing protein [Nevskiaceae bacterium]